MSDAPGQTSDQQTRALWADERQQVYAVVLGERVPGLRGRLAEAEVDDWDALWTGELGPEELEAAPILVALQRESGFTRWLLNEAGRGHGEWGLILRSRLSFVPLRSHGRALCQAQLPDGSELRLAWADPAVLMALLPLAPADQLAAVFAPIESIVIVGTRQWTRVSFSLGGLQVQRAALLPAA